MDASISVHTNYNTANTNFGDDIWFKAYCLPGYNGGENSNRGLISFDLSDIPAGASISSAQLYLYAAGYVNELIPGHFGSNSAYIRRMSSPWLESSVTWNSSPTSTTVNQVVVPASSSSTEDYVMEVGALVQDMVSDAQSSHGFLLRQQVENPSNPSCLVFHSSDEADPAKHPKLVVTYTAATMLCIQPNAEESPDVSVGYHYSYNTENTNFGDDIWFKAFCIPGANGDANTTRSILDFDLSILPTGTTLVSAELSLFAAGYVNDLIPGHFGVNAALLQRVVGPWTEFSVTWNTQPSTTVTDQVLVPASSSGAEDYTIDVTGLVEAALGDPANSFGFLMRQVVEDPDEPSCLVFWLSDSSDPDEHPRLCLTYTLHGAVGQVEVSERERGLRVFPYPSNGMFTVQVPPDGSITTIQLIGGMGEVVYDWRGQTLQKERLILEFPAVASGRYMLRIVGPEMVRYAPVVLMRP